MSDEKECFVIAPIGEEDTEMRKRSDDVLNNIIKPIVEDYGYEAERADEIQEPGMIPTQIIERVIESDLVIADLTGSNPNVFYELAVRHAYNKPFIQLIDTGENLPFDVGKARTIRIDRGTAGSIRKVEEELERQIEAIESDDFDADNPISDAVELKRLRESGDPERESLADIKESISELQNSVTSIQNKFNNPEELFPERLTQKRELKNKEEMSKSLTAILDAATDIMVTIDEVDLDEDTYEKIDNSTGKLVKNVYRLETRLAEQEDDRSHHFMAAELANVDIE
jgi:hypothetical protein